MSTKVCKLIKAPFHFQNDLGNPDCLDFYANFKKSSRKGDKTTCYVGKEFAI